MDLETRPRRNAERIARRKGACDSTGEMSSTARLHECSATELVRLIGAREVFEALLVSELSVLAEQVRPAISAAL